MRETDDFNEDVEFGKWLCQIRTHANLTLKDAADKAGVAEQRLRSLELGYSERGIKNSEVTALSKIYGIPSDAFLKKALGEG